MAQDDSGNLIDLFGGQADLVNRILKTPLEPNITFLDDPLRLFRPIRFTITKNLTMDPSLWVAFKNHLIYQKLWAVVSSERIREELTKMFAFNTSPSLKLLFEFGKENESVYSTFLSDLFEKTGIWLKPTTEKIK